MASGTQDVKQESTFRPSAQQEEIIGLAMPWIREFSQHPPGSPTGTQIAPFNQTQVGAQQGILDSIPGMLEHAQGAAQGNQFLFSGDVLKPESNPGLAGAISAATDPIVRHATEQLLPNVRGSAVNAGQYGGTRQALAEGQVADATLRQVGDTSAQLANEGYQSGLDAMVKGIALAPQTQAGLASPYALQNSVGDVQQGLTQAQMSEQWQQERLADMWPALIAKEIMGQQSMIPGGTNVTEGEQPGPSLFQQLTGGIGALGGLFSLFL
jgi:hypothetical protein